MTVAQLVQLYAPLAGLLILAAWCGALSQRVKTLEREERERRAQVNESGDHDRLVRVEVTMDTMGADIESIKRAMEGVQRQLGNLATRRGGVFASDEEAGR